MYKDPYLVVGTGRSGTSFVAGVLHNDMGICMGDEFPPANPTNPGGFWEDIDFYTLNTRFMLGEMNFDEFMRGAIGYIKERKNRGIPWGLKESRMATLLGLYLSLLNQPKIIWTQRDANLVIKSLQKWYGYTEDAAIKLYETRMLLLKRILQGRDLLIIRFDKSTKTKEEVISAIGDKW